MLKANDLEDLVACAQNVRDSASTMLSKWLQLEVDAVCEAVQDDDDNDIEDEVVEVLESGDKLSPLIFT